jgi:hypothetical protein
MFFYLADLAMSSSAAKEGGGGIEKKSVVNYYLNSVMAPPKTLRFKEGLLLVEDMEAPKTEGSLEERLGKLEEDTRRYRIIVEHSLDAHFHMGLDLEKRLRHMREGSRI